MFSCRSDALSHFKRTSKTRPTRRAVLRERYLPERRALSERSAVNRRRHSVASSSSGHSKPAFERLVLNASGNRPGELSTGRVADPLRAAQAVRLMKHLRFRDVIRNAVRMSEHAMHAIRAEKTNSSRIHRTIDMTTVFPKWRRLTAYRRQKTN